MTGVRRHSFSMLVSGYEQVQLSVTMIEVRVCTILVEVMPQDNQNRFYIISRTDRMVSRVRAASCAFPSDPISSWVLLSKK